LALVALLVLNLAVEPTEATLYLAQLPQLEVPEAVITLEKVVVQEAVDTHLATLAALELQTKVLLEETVGLALVVVAAVLVQ
jgi:hypothetical protein